MTALAQTLLAAAAGALLASPVAHAAQDQPAARPAAPRHAPASTPRAAPPTTIRGPGAPATPSHAFPQAFGGGAHPADVRPGGPPPSPQPPPGPAGSAGGPRRGPLILHVPEAGGSRAAAHPAGAIGRRPVFTYRGVTRPAFRTGGFRWPAGYGYRRYSRGARLPFLFLNPGYALWDYAALDLAPPPYAAAHWLRYGPDALLVDDRTGEVLDVAYGVFAGADGDGDGNEVAGAGATYGPPAYVTLPDGGAADDGGEDGDDAPY